MLKGERSRVVPAPRIPLHPGGPRGRAAPRSSPPNTAPSQRPFTRAQALIKAQRKNQPGGRRNGRRPRPPPGERRYNPVVPLNADGIPAAVPDAPKPSGIVAIAAESRARYPWLPARVIVGSVWRGPGQERVRVDEQGAAIPL